jgi:hypothetical protein
MRKWLEHLRKTLEQIPGECRFSFYMFFEKGSFLKDCCFFKNFLRDTCDNKVDWNGRCETPMGAAGQVRPRRSDSDEEAHRPPHGKRASWSAIQLDAILKATKFKKTAF